MLEVIVPSVRQMSPERLVYSLSRGSQKPDLVTIVTNETLPFDTFGLKVRFLRFESETYLYGEKDVALRTNIGMHFAEHDYVVVQGDDQIASSRMIECSEILLDQQNYFWGNHRITDYRLHSTDEILAAGDELGTSRENPIPPADHWWQSCYTGMFGFRRDFLIPFGTIDMAFNGRHGGEDQQLGLRLMTAAGEHHVRIEDPPYSWAGTDPDEEWLPRPTNSCGSHEYSGDVPISRCNHCPAIHVPQEALFEPRVLIPFDRQAVTVEAVHL
jgi:hypothetical protein